MRDTGGFPPPKLGLLNQAPPFSCLPVLLRGKVADGETSALSGLLGCQAKGVCIGLGHVQRTPQGRVRALPSRCFKEHRHCMLGDHGCDALSALANDQVLNIFLLDQPGKQAEQLGSIQRDSSSN
eukprot:1540187-Amphidinium_carterae.1